MKNIALILHGVSGYAGKHWMQWLHDELIQKDFEIIMPTLPNADSPIKSEWLEFITKILQNVDHQSLTIVGHSLGVPAGLQYIQDQNIKIKGLISVSGFHRDYCSEINTKFMKETNIDLANLKNLITNKSVIFGDNDPYVPQEVLYELANGLEVEPIVLKNAGHVNTDTGYSTLPVILELIDPKE
jgi:uncharacterized protein